MIDAVIFDMDGLLIDSEPMWKEAETKVFSSVGVEVKEHLAALTATMTTREVTNFWYSHSPWHHKTLEQVESAVIDQVQRFIAEKGEMMPGVRHVLELFKDSGLKVGLSTNSPYKLINTVLERLSIKHYFNAVSSSDSEKEGKPAPDVYITTARKLQVDSSKCIAFEDSVSGLTAAKSAKMKTVAIPQMHDFDNPRYDVAHLKLRSLADFNETHLQQLAG